MVFFRYFEGIFEIQNQSAVGNAEVRTNLFEKIPNPFGIFLLSVFFGLVGKKGKMLSVSNYQYMLKNKIYYGMIEYNGELYDGKHVPIITKKLFDLCQ
ncbi:MAG: recombinase family protein [bacterium]